jgi:hypothetical protein
VRIGYKAPHFLKSASAAAVAFENLKIFEFPCFQKLLQIKSFCVT